MELKSKTTVRPRLIAFYLPQFHPFKENDEWWGKGFTEWTNVAKAKPLFRGHYQPKIPADLGFYDLRLPETRELQAEMARKAGIEGFCYWHYWFGSGKRLMNRVFDEVVKTKEPKFPFCLCWANHSWFAKTWNPDTPDKLLIEQTYPGIKDYTDHFLTMLPAFKDPRYIKVNGKLVFGIFAPMDFPDFSIFKDTWNRLAKENGLEGFYFFGYTPIYKNINRIKEQGYDSVVFDGISDCILNENTWLHYYRAIKNRIFRRPRRTLSYQSYANNMIRLVSNNNNFIPSIVPNFDHTPRSGYRAFVLKDSSPQLWEKLCREVFRYRQQTSHEENLIFIKAWNEWGEGNYLEPDLKYGKAYLQATKNALKEI